MLLQKSRTMMRGEDVWARSLLQNLHMPIRACVCASAHPLIFRSKNCGLLGLIAYLVERSVSVLGADANWTQQALLNKVNWIIGVWWLCARFGFRYRLKQRTDEQVAAFFFQLSRCCPWKWSIEVELMSCHHVNLSKVLIKSFFSRLIDHLRLVVPIGLWKPTESTVTSRANFNYTYSVWKPSVFSLYHIYSCITLCVRSFVFWVVPVRHCNFVQIICCMTLHDQQWMYVSRCSHRSIFFRSPIEYLRIFYSNKMSARPFSMQMNRIIFKLKKENVIITMQRYEMLYAHLSYTHTIGSIDVVFFCFFSFQ